MTRRVLVFDTTLRDGEQSPGFSMNIAEKVTLAKQLARLGVDIIEAGFPVASEGDFQAVVAIHPQISLFAIAVLYLLSGPIEPVVMYFVRRTPGRHGRHPRVPDELHRHQGKGEQHP